MTRSIAGRHALRVLAGVLVLAGLGVDAYVHLDLAGTYDVVRTRTLSQGTLFRVEAAAAIGAAAAALLRPRRWTAVVAALVAVAGFAAITVYRYVDVGRLGPVPAMYEPAWYPEKLWAAWSQAVATVSAAVLAAATPRTPSGKSADGRERVKA
jgi:hypothetical protein